MNSVRRFRERLADWLPFDTLRARTMAIVLIGISTVHVVSLWTYQYSLREEMALSDDARLADRLITIKRAVMRAPPAQRETVAHDLSGGPIEAHWSLVEYAVEGGPGAETLASLGKRLQQLSPELAEGGLVIGSNREAAGDPHFALISMRLPDSSWVNVSLVSWTNRVPSFHGTWLSATLMAIGAVLVSVFLVQWLTKPLAAVAEAASRFQGGSKPVPVAETGPREVRSLAMAFNDMQNRISRLLVDRTQALAAVSHDLKTPITRLRFRVEDVGDEALRRDMAADLADMELMIDQTLAYLRGDRTEEELKPVDVNAILETVTDMYNDRGEEASLSGSEGAVIVGRHLALKRAFSNLVDNATKYGGTARVAVEDAPGEIIVSISDNGPGIAPQDREKALMPFSRLEPSRNRLTGGFGLGLTIAKAVIEGHGGELCLEQGKEAGLMVVVRLPKSGPG
jgi:signal transduction histidine kinase